MGDKDKAALARAAENRLWAKDIADASEALLAELTRRCTTLTAGPAADSAAIPTVDQERLGRMVRLAAAAAVCDAIAATIPEDDEDDDDPFHESLDGGPNKPFSLVDPKP